MFRRQRRKSGVGHAARGIESSSALYKDKDVVVGISARFDLVVFRYSCCLLSFSLLPGMTFTVNIEAVHA